MKKNFFREDGDNFRTGGGTTVPPDPPKKP